MDSIKSENQNANKYRFFTPDALVFIAAGTMLLDHTGAVFFKDIEILRVIGRIAFVLYADMAATAVLKTSDLRMYLLRLGLFSVISQIPYNMTFHGVWFTPEHWNIGFTILLGAIISACLYRIIRMDNPFRKSLFLLLWTASVSVLLPFCDSYGIDYGAYGIVLVLLMFLYEYVRSVNIPRITWTASAAMMILLFFTSRDMNNGPMHFGLESQCWSILAVPLILLRADSKTKRTHNIGYWFYPVHLLLFAAIKRCI